MKSASRLIVGMFALIAAAPAFAGKHDFPNKPLRMMIAFAAGGSTDIGARIVASIAEKDFKQPIVVVNRGGAGGQVGWTELSRQRADGYSIGFINLPATNTVVLDPERKAIFKIEDFVPIINQVLDPGVVYVRADSPYKTMKDLIEAARKSPNTIRTATTGILSDDHLAILMVEESAPGSAFRIVHLAGGADQQRELLAGNIDVAFDNVGGWTPRVRAKEFRALAVLDPQRSKFLPDVPTMRELGYPKVVSNSTRGIAGPKGIPAPVVKHLETVFKKAMESPEHLEKLEAAGLTVRIMVGEEYAKYYRETHEKARHYTEWAKKRPHR
ncbi:MAG: tripartite tricarboxylate transporter substrate binding protein [Betaproteobacteria bacterium]|nr:tripartite tricarboxylate transporter substrate binding protein [Betaproteobacteria bacterium]